MSRSRGDCLQARRDINPVAHEVAVALLHHVAEMDADPKIRCACLRTLRNGAAEVVAVERQIIRPKRFNLPLPAVRRYRQTLAMRDLETWCAQHHPIPGHPPHAGHEHLEKSGL